MTCSPEIANRDAGDVQNHNDDIYLMDELSSPAGTVELSARTEVLEGGANCDQVP